MARKRRLGSVTVLPNGRVLARVQSGRRIDGSPRTMSRVVDTEAEAEVAIAQMAAEMGRDPHAGERVLLSWYFEALFVPGREGNVTRAMMRQYRGVWRNHIEPTFGSWYIEDIDHAAVQAWVYDSPTRQTAEKRVRILRAILNQARMDGVTSSRVMEDRYRLPRGTTRPGPVWSADEVARALPVIRRTPLARLWCVMVGGGAGREEAAALYERDLTYTPVTRMGPDGPEEGWAVTCQVSEVVTPEDGRKEPKNDRRYRCLYIEDPFATVLWQTRGDDPDEPICPIYVGGIPRAWNAMWEPRKVGTDGNGRYYRGCMLGTGVPRIPPNRMRATHESLMQQAGVQDTLNAALHGRSNVQTGYRHYLVPGDASAARAAEAVGEAVRLAR